MFEEMLDMCGMIDDPDRPKGGKHRDLEPAQIRKSEAAVQNVITAISHFTNPWRISDKDRLYSLASGAPIPVEIEKDVLGADELGKKLKNEFIEKRLKHDSKMCFFDTINQRKLKTMEDNGKRVALTTSEGKIIQYQEQSDLAFKLLVKSQVLETPLDLEQLLSYSLSPVPHCLGTADGFFAKTNKASMLHCLMEDQQEEVPYPRGPLYIQDGNALFHSLKNLPPTFGGITLNLLDLMVQRSNFVFSTDSYQPGSIKGQERMRRGWAEKFLLDGPATRRPKDFKLFLSNDENKKQFCDVIRNVWESPAAASRLEKSNYGVLIVDGAAISLSSSNGEVVIILIGIKIYEIKKEGTS